MDIYTQPLLNALLTAFHTEFDGDSHITIFSGPVPETAGAATAGATALVTLSGPSGVPLEFELPTDGLMPKSTSQVWSGDPDATGVAAFFRLHKASDDPTTASASAMRAQGTVGVANANLLLSNPLIEIGTPWTLDNFFVTLPA